MVVVGYLLALAGLYLLGGGLRQYREGEVTRATVRTAAALAFVVVGLSMMYGVEQIPLVVVAVFGLVAVALSAYVSARE